MRTPLDHWYSDWCAKHENTRLFYVCRDGEGVSLQQVSFVRRQLDSIVWSDVQYREGQVYTWVIGEHTSKSVRLPVYLIERPELGISFVLRYNFHDWCVSVMSDLPIASGLRGFDDSARYCGGFEGFPEHARFKGFRDSRSRFSISLHNDYEAYAFFREIMMDVRQSARAVAKTSTGL